jgi:hypothetical protein
MPLELSPLTPADIDAYMSIRQAAFGSTVYQILFSGQPSAATVAQAKTSIENMLLNPTNAHFLKVTDTETGEVIAGAKWKAILTDEERERELEMPEPSEEADPRCFREFMRLLSEVKGGVMGVRAYWSECQFLPSNSRVGGILTYSSARCTDDAPGSPSSGGGGAVDGVGDSAGG